MRGVSVDAEIKRLLREADRYPRTVSTGLQAIKIAQGDRSPEEIAEGFTIDDLNFCHDFAAFAVLVRDFAIYLEEHPRDDAAIFLELVSETEAEERIRFADAAFPRLAGQPTEVLPTGYAAAAAKDRPTFAGLENKAIVHEWTTWPGVRVLVRFLNRSDVWLRPRICDPGGLLEQYAAKRLSAVELHTAIAGALMTGALKPEAFWLPIAVQCSVIIFKRGLSRYCASKPTGKAHTRTGRKAVAPAQGSTGSKGRRKAPPGRSRRRADKDSPDAPRRRRSNRGE